MTTLLNIPFAAAQMETLKKVKILVKWESRTASTGFLLKEYNQALYTADTLYKTAVDVFKTSNVIDNLQSLSPNIAKHTQLGFTQGLIKINGVIFFCYFECFQGGRNPDTDFHLYPITFFKSVIDCKHDYTVLHQHLFENTNSLCLYKVLESTNYWAIKTAFNIKSIDYMAWLVSNDKLNYFFREKGIQVVFFTNQYQDDVLDKVKAFKVGGVDYITKPFQTEEVIARIENQLTISKLRKELEKRNEQLAKEKEALIEEQKRTNKVFSTLVDLLPGLVLDKKYKLEKKIGKKRLF